MTSKHFNLIADALGKDMAKSIPSSKAAKMLDSTGVEIRHWETLKALATTNPAFDHARFVDAVVKSAKAAFAAM